MATSSSTLDATRRRFLAQCSSLGLGGTLLPGVLWAEWQTSGAQQITPAMLQHALVMAGLTFSEEDQKGMLDAVNQNLRRFTELREIHIPNDVSPPFHFSALVPGMTVNRTKHPFRMSTPAVKRPANLEDVAFWPVVQLAQLIKTRQATSRELTDLYLARLHRYNPTLNCAVTILDDLARAQAAQADAEIAAGKYKGPLHGIPWGAKDIIAVKGYKTTWGSGAFKDQMIDGDASVVTMLRDAGAVLVAKLTTGEIAQGDRWFGGQTKSPWDPTQGSGGSSAGPGSATAAGLVGFSIGTETSGSILGPSARCGVTGLRPTLGRISRDGVMALSWTQDRLGPMCRSAEDCALVMSVVARPDNRDMSVVDIPFNWDAQLDIRKLRIGYIKAAFDENTDPVGKSHQQQTLDALTKLGVKLVTVDVPEFTTDVSAINVESATFFDEFMRTGRDKFLTNLGRANGWKGARVLPAVDYLQAQRIRMMMMMKLAEATAHVDVYLGPGNGGGAGGGGRGGTGATGLPAVAPRAEAGAGGGRGASGAGGAGDPEPRRQGPGQRHSSMANLATYPAVAVRNGFNAAGAPTSITFFARPFGESELLAVVKAYQDATGFHLRSPQLT
jgi:Asp-tRNA(Asn)/Glu-tRNA(Gln) amidotransferase A subunit family amidase